VGAVSYCTSDSRLGQPSEKGRRTSTLGCRAVERHWRVWRGCHHKTRARARVRWAWRRKDSSIFIACKRDAEVLTCARRKARRWVAMEEAQGYWCRRVGFAVRITVRGMSTRTVGFKSCGFACFPSSLFGDSDSLGMHSGCVNPRPRLQGHRHSRIHCGYVTRTRNSTVSADVGSQKRQRLGGVLRNGIRKQIKIT